MTATVNGGKPTLGLDMTQGSLERTNRPLDIGISGNGFLAIKTGNGPDDIALTRNGHLFIDNERYLVWGMANSRRIVPAIQLPPGSQKITISEDGSVAVASSDPNALKQIGQIDLHVVRDPTSLRFGDDGLYHPTSASGPAVQIRPGEAAVAYTLQNFLESSNVSVARERLRMKFLEEWKDALVQPVQ